MRKEYSYGKQTDHFDNAHCIGWVREGIDEKPNTGCAVVISSHPHDKMSRHMNVGKKFAGKVFHDFLQHCKDEMIIDENGDAEFFAEAQSVSAWVIKL